MLTKIGLVAVAVTVALVLTGHAPAHASLTNNGAGLQGVSDNGLASTAGAVSGGATAVVVELPTDAAVSH